MMYGDYNRERTENRDRDKNYNCVKYLIYMANIVLLITSLMMLAGAIYILVEKAFISDIMENQLLKAGVWLCIIGGSLLVLSISLCGFVAAALEKKRLLATFIVFLSFLFLVFLAGCLCAAILRGQIGEWIIDRMERSIKDEYGFNLDNEKNRFITQQWDKAQNDMYCCGVREQSWSLYRQSRWYAEQPALWGDPMSGHQGKPYVPESCCKVDRDGTPTNLQKCQYSMEGPPFKQSGDVGSNLYNYALHYRGCYEAGKEWIRYNGAWIIGFGAGFAGVLILAIVFSIMLLIRLRK